MTEDKTKRLVEVIRAGDKSGLDALLREDTALLRFASPNGSSLALLTAYYGHPELAEVLIKRGAKLDIFEASALGDLDRVSEVGKANDEAVNSFSPDGFFPLGLAAFFGHRKIVEFLLAEGADVRAVARNAQGVTALHGGVARRDIEIVKMLLEHGADPNARQERGFAPLHDAAANGNEALVLLLIEHGASAAARTDDGKTAADMAAERGHAELAAELRRQAVA